MHCSHTMWKLRLHHHSIATYIYKLTVHVCMDSNSLLVCFCYGCMSDIHECSECLQLALVIANEKPPGCKLPHDWLMLLSIDLVTFCGIYSTNEPIWKCDYLTCVYPDTIVASYHPQLTTPIRAIGSNL